MGADDRPCNLPLLYNGLVETAMRSLVILDAFYPHAFSFEEIRLLDYFAVFPGDIGGARNLHLPHSGRAGAYGVRPAAIGKGLDYLTEIGHVLRTGEGRAALFRAADEGPAVTGFIRSPYLTGIHVAAEWMLAKLESEGREAFFAHLCRRMAELSLESMAMPARQQERFEALALLYRCDAERIEGLAEAAWAFAVMGRPGLEERAVEATMPEARSDKWLAGVGEAAEKERRSLRSRMQELADVMAQSAA